MANARERAFRKAGHVIPDTAPQERPQEPALEQELAGWLADFQLMRLYRLASIGGLDTPRYATACRACYSGGFSSSLATCLNRDQTKG